MCSIIYTGGGILILKKSAIVQIRLEPELKEEFVQWCAERAINPSEWLRLQIKKAVKEER
jgi:antitoxin component of RelBE/YafQ-DinJ toxin-antitoxin module